MDEQTGADYQSSKYAKALIIEKAKFGKTVFIVSSLLGILPWQKLGGIVGKPQNLHVITFDSGALGGMKRFALELCKAKEESLKYRVYNMQNDLMKTAGAPLEYDRTFYNTVMSTVLTIRNRIESEGGTHAIHISSVTGMVEGLLRSIAGPAAKKKNTMDQTKWGDFAGQLAEIRNYTQIDTHHTIWEGHIYTPPQTGQNADDAPVQKETLQMPGKSGQNFPFNVEQVFRVKREWSNTHPGTNVDKMFLDPRGGADFMQGGRNFDALKDKEYDMTAAFKRLGLKVGGWGAPKTAK